MFQKLIFCDCRGEAIAEDAKSKVLDLISRINSTKIRISDLCGLCVSDRDAVRELFHSESKTLVIACYPKAVKYVLNFAGITNFDHITFLSLRDGDEKQSLKTIELLMGFSIDQEPIGEISSGKDWPAWYPVLDYSKCTSCGQCADFCLFGVYAKTDRNVEVVNPEACKNNCPACARICPHFAIIFPKYTHGGAISGSEKFDEQEEQKRQLEDMDKILGSDIYKALEMRKAKRQSIINDKALKKAYEEREKALKERLN